MKHLYKTIAVLLITLLIGFTPKMGSAQTDTLKVMTYNVLNYGDGCNGPWYKVHGYLKTIVGFTQPDILGLVKVQSIKRNASDVNGTLWMDFPDSIVQYALNASGPKKYGYCTFTNEARGSNVELLFYNSEKLVYVSTRILVSNVVDFDLFKFYYKDPNLATTKDTTYLYVVLNHTQSGDDATIRNAQMTAVFNAIKYRFTYLPNLICMGDFNLRSSSETGYNQLVTSPDTNFLFSDPPFAIDKQLTYPAAWDKVPSYSRFFTTSTRLSATIPNACGTSGGAKNWYDHILFSPWMVNGTNYMQYVPNSYTTIGNDGNRFGIDANDNITRGPNTSAPSDVIEALFQLSNKYPIVSKIVVRQNTTGISPTDPEKYYTGVTEVLMKQHNLRILNRLDQLPMLVADETLLGSTIRFTLSDLTGRIVLHQNLLIDETSKTLDLNVSNGTYFLQMQDVFGNSSVEKVIINH